MTDLTPKPQQPAPVTDSPLFWLLLFGVVGLGALVAVGPRHAVRQGKLQQKFEARERIARKTAEQAAGVPETETAVEAPEPPTLLPLFAVMTAFVAIVAIALAVQRLRA